ncbi:Hypothetical protein glysoja_027213 [Glycine soja]|uniref:PPM-type phosphatase domain-containing protein n=1 Tax=Glycine soja TaxID=3848 RepID=A0A0B2SJW9_GLYSO|nr:Hypothetical protein glysoja_027213 [Glycine soja]
MEDASVMLLDVSLDYPGNLRCAHFAIYDGHGGRLAAEYARKHLHQNVLSAGLPRSIIMGILLNNLLMNSALGLFLFSLKSVVICFWPFLFDEYLDSTPTKDDKDPEPTSSPVQHKEDKNFGNQYQRRKKPDLVQQQLQSSKSEVRTHTLEDTLDASCESNLDDLLISLRKGKRSCAKYPISQFVSTKNLSL